METALFRFHITPTSHAGNKLCAGGYRSEQMLKEQDLVTCLQVYRKEPSLMALVTTRNCQEETSCICSGNTPYTKQLEASTLPGFGANDTLYRIQKEKEAISQNA
eukprot:1157390-Pelagomonas_calceolata.AAC.12